MLAEWPPCERGPGSPTRGQGDDIGERVGLAGKQAVEVAAEGLERDAFHGEWNYTIQPNESA